MSTPVTMILWNIYPKNTYRRKLKDSITLIVIGSFFMPIFKLSHFCCGFFYGQISLFHCVFGKERSRNHVSENPFSLISGFEISTKNSKSEVL